MSEAIALYGPRLVDFLSMRHAFAVDATLACMAIGGLCGLVGTFMVLRGLALVGDAAGHATLPGICLGFLVAGSKAIGALLVGAATSAATAVAAIAWIERGPRSRPDAALGTVLSVSFGFGVVLLSIVQRSPTGAQSGLNQFLYGSAAAVTRGQLWEIAVVTALLGGAVVAWFRPLALFCFDPTYARAVGLPTKRMQAGLLAGLTVAVVVGIQAVGVVLVAAMLILPPSTARLLTRRLSAMAAWGAAFGASAGFVGAAASYVFDGLATGPTMVLVAAATFGCTLALTRLRAWGAFGSGSAPGAT